MSPLDKTDLGIIDLLSRDARVSNRQIASDLGVTEGTIRSRVRRLQESGMIRFSLITDFRMAGAPNLVMFGIAAEPGRVRALAAEISKIEAINCVIVLLGRYSLLAMGLFTTVERVDATVHSVLLSLPGVLHVDVSFAVHTLKYDVRKARITSQFGPALL